MIVFLTRIPPDTTSYDVIGFLQPSLKGSFFKKTGYVHSVRIMILRDMIANKKEFHALVTVEPDKVAARIIRELNRKPINGKHIAVREYVQRNWQNDPRTNMHQWNEELVDKRGSSRRRGNKLEVLENRVTKFRGREGFRSFE